MRLVIHDAPDRPVSSHGFDRQAGGFPLRVTVLKTANAITPCPQRRHGFERKDAVGTATVGDHLTTLWKFAEASFQFGKRDVERAWQMAQREFILGPHIK
jgi:hypothetical protein